MVIQLLGREIPACLGRSAQDSPQERGNEERNLHRPSYPHLETKRTMNPET